jgi:hypothetical protein
MKHRGKTDRETETETESVRETDRDRDRATVSWLRCEEMLNEERNNGKMDGSPCPALPREWPSWDLIQTNGLWSVSPSLCPRLLENPSSMISGTSPASVLLLSQTFLPLPHDSLMNEQGRGTGRRDGQRETNIHLFVIPTPLRLSSHGTVPPSPPLSLPSSALPLLPPPLSLSSAVCLCLSVSVGLRSNQE